MNWINEINSLRTAGQSDEVVRENASARSKLKRVYRLMDEISV